MSLGKALLILLSLYLQVLIMQISTQTDNHKYRESAATKRSTLLKKRSVKYWNPKFSILCKIAFIDLLKNANLLEFRGQYGHSETSKRGRIGLWLYTSIFQETKTMYTKLVSETVHYINFTSKFVWNHFYQFTICIIYLELSTKYFQQLEHHIEKPSISVENCPWFPWYTSL